MPDIMETETIDLAKRPCGSIGPGQWDGQPVDALLHAVCYRADIAPGAHPIHPASGFTHWRMGGTGACDRLPSPFPPANWGELNTVQDVLDCVAACKVPNAEPTKTPPQPAKWDKEAGTFVHAHDRHPVTVTPPSAPKVSKSGE